jgi:hypothetical protein
MCGEMGALRYEEPFGSRCRKTSTFPFSPSIGDSVSPTTDHGVSTSMNVRRS